MTDANEVTVDDRDITLLVVAFLALVMTIGLLVFNLVIVERSATRADQTYRSACSYRDYLSQQAKNSLDYLNKHPNGAPALGLSATYIRTQIQHQQAAVQSLNDLHCQN